MKNFINNSRNKYLILFLLIIIGILLINTINFILKKLKIDYSQNIFLKLIFYFGYSLYFLLFIVNIVFPIILVIYYFKKINKSKSISIGKGLLYGGLTTFSINAIESIITISGYYINKTWVFSGTLIGPWGILFSIISFIYITIGISILILKWVVFKFYKK